MLGKRLELFCRILDGFIDMGHELMLLARKID